MSAACTSAPSTAAASAAPIAPAPQHRSTITARPGRSRPAGRGTRFRRRGTNTPGATVVQAAELEPAEDLLQRQPGRALSDQGIVRQASGAADISSRASSSANTQPAARSLATTESGTAVLGLPAQGGLPGRCLVGGFPGQLGDLLVRVNLPITVSTICRVGMRYPRHQLGSSPLPAPPEYPQLRVSRDPRVRGPKSSLGSSQPSAASASVIIPATSLS